MNKERIIISISNLIDDILTSDYSVADLLLKASVLARRLGNNVMHEWCQNEMSGYKGPRDPSLPHYRKVACTPGVRIVTETFTHRVDTGYRELNTYIADLEMLKKLAIEQDEFLTNLYNISIVDGVDEISQMVFQDNSSKLSPPYSDQIMMTIFPPDQLAGGNILSIRYARIVPSQVLRGIPFKVKQNLLNIITSFESEFGTSEEFLKAQDNIIKQKSEQLVQQVLHIEHLGELNMNNKYEQNADIIQGNQGDNGTANIHNNTPLISQSPETTFPTEQWKTVTQTLLSALVLADENDQLEENGGLVEGITLVKRIQKLEPTSKEEALTLLEAEFNQNEQSTLKSILALIIGLQIPVLQGIQASAIFEMLKIWLGVK